jgi:hypothetical protein
VRAQAGEPVQELAQWWKDYIDGDTSKRRGLLKEIGAGPKKRKSRRRSSTHDE